MKNTAVTDVLRCLKMPENEEVPPASGTPEAIMKKFINVCNVITTISSI